MKKTLALILSIVMIMSMSIAAFADVTIGDVSYSDQTTVTIKKLYKLVGEGESLAESFTLEQVGNGTVTEGEATEAPALGAIQPAQFAAGAATAEGAEGEIVITLPSYANVGKYEYVLKEVAGSTAGVTYYGNNIKLVVTVINDEPSGTLRVAGVHTELQASDAKSDTFENTFSTGDLAITKTVAGSLGDKTKYFEFTVSLKGEAGKTYAESYTVSGGSSESNPSTIVVDEPTKVYLKDGETLTIENLPYGVEYTVEEADYSADEYETTSTGETGTIEAATQTAAFTNTKGGTPDTGILLDSLPYVIIIGLVAAAGIFMVAKRRKAAAEE